MVVDCSFVAQKPTLPIRERVVDGIREFGVFGPIRYGRRASILSVSAGARRNAVIRINVVISKTFLMRSRSVKI